MSKKSVSDKNINVVILNGSPRKKGNTVAAIELLETALQKHPVTAKRHNLYQLDFKGCSHCGACKKQGKVGCCVLKDQFTPLLGEIARADAIIIASPVYCWSVTGCTSAALDRFYCLFGKDGHSLLQGTKIAGLFTAGGDVFDGMEMCVNMTKQIASYADASYVGTIAAANCTTAPSIKKNRELKELVKGVVRGIVG